MLVQSPKGTVGEATSNDSKDNGGRGLPTIDLIQDNIHGRQGKHTSQDEGGFIT
jgi:hypothetical protein